MCASSESASLLVHLFPDLSQLCFLHNSVFGFHLSQSDALALLPGFCIAAPCCPCQNMLVSRTCLIITLKTQTWIPKTCMECAFCFCWTWVPRKVVGAQCTSSEVLMFDYLAFLMQQLKGQEERWVSRQQVFVFGVPPGSIWVGDVCFLLFVLILSVPCNCMLVCVRVSAFCVCIVEFAEQVG